MLELNLHGFALALLYDPVEGVPQQGTSAIDVGDLLARRPEHKLDAVSGQLATNRVRLCHPRFAVHDQLPHGAMNADPKCIQGVDQTAAVPTLDQTGGMPSRTPINQVKDGVLVDKHEIALNLLVKCVCKLH